MYSFSNAASCDRRGRQAGLKEAVATISVVGLEDSCSRSEDVVVEGERWVRKGILNEGDDAIGLLIPQR